MKTSQTHLDFKMEENDASHLHPLPKERPSDRHRPFIAGGYSVSNLSNKRSELFAVAPVSFQSFTAGVETYF